MRKNKQRTVDEVLRDQSQDDEYQEMRKRREEERAKLREERRLEQAGLVEELASNGVEVDSVWDLVNRENDYDSVVPLLVHHLLKGYSPRTLEGILRALRVRTACPYLNQISQTNVGEDWSNQDVLKDTVEYLRRNRGNQSQ